jgi:hypothetical protein
VSRRTDLYNSHWEHSSRLEPAHAEVGRFSDEDELERGQIATKLPQVEEVAHNFARVATVRPSIDYRNAASSCDFEEVLVTLRPDDEQGKPVLQITGNVLDGLMHAEVTRYVGNGGPHFARAELEGNPISETLSMKPKRDALAAEHLRHRLASPKFGQVIGAV